MFKLFRCKSSLILLLVGNIFISPASFASLSGDQSVGVYFSHSGREYFRDNFQNILDANGVQFGDVYYPKQVAQLDERSTEQFGSTQQEQEDIRNTLEILKRYLGFTLNRHQISIELNGVRFRSAWEEIGLEIMAPPVRKNGELGIVAEVQAQLFIKARDISFNVDRLQITDQNNLDIGTVGFNQLSVAQDTKSPSLVMMIPLTLVRSGAGFSVNFGSIATNIDEVLLGFDYAPPLELPKFEGQIGDRKFELQIDEVEKFVNSNKREIIAAFKKSAIEFVASELPTVLEDNINSLFKDGFSETNRMDPPGAPEGQIVDGYLWGAQLMEINYHGDFLHLGLDVKIVDPTESKGPELERDQIAHEMPSKFPVNNGNYDIIFSLNQGLINRAIQLSSQRGYFSTIESEGKSIRLTKRPVLNLKRRYDRSRNFWHKQGTMTVEIEHKVTGFGAALVHNPIRIEFDLKVGFRVEPDGRVSMRVTGIDLGSSYVADKYISWWGSKVRAGVVAELKLKQSELRGLVLADDLPIPRSMVGIDIEVVDVTIDPAGHILASCRIRKEQ